MRNRLETEGPDGFETHELLEMLLYYSLPQGNTNEIAHLLLNQFGSLDAILSASRDELMIVKGIGEKSADLIRIVGGLRRRVALEEISTDIVYDSVGKIGRFLCNLYVGINVERVYLMLFDNAMRMIDCAHICDGSINAATMQPRIMIEKALFKHASFIVVAHNHPSGYAIPSGDDINTTEILRSSFELLGIHMLEHIVVAGTKYSPIMRMRNMTFETAGNVSTGNAHLFDHFFDDLAVDTVSDLPSAHSDAMDK